MDHEGRPNIQVSRLYFHLVGQSVLIRSANPDHAFTLVVGIGYFEDIRERNPHLSFEYKDPFARAPH